jgi:hypothetical protein
MYRKRAEPKTEPMANEQAQLSPNAAKIYISIIFNQEINVHNPK